jgi:hypothetical protein
MTEPVVARFTTEKKAEAYATFRGRSFRRPPAGRALAEVSVGGMR